MYMQSDMCVIMAEDKTVINELLMTDFMLYNAWKQF